MPLVLSLPPEEEAQFEAWAAQQDESVQQDARVVYSAAAERTWWQTLATLFYKALMLTRPVLDEAAKQELGGAHYLLILLQTMTALYHANGGRPFTAAELSRRTPLEDAMTLYDLHVVSLGIAARIANVSISEFIDALGRAGISIFQYTSEEVLAEVVLPRWRVYNLAEGGPSQMAGTQPVLDETAEAIIISGARKGEFIRVEGGEVDLTPAEAALLDSLTADARRMAESARAAAEEADAVLRELRQARAR
jgi:predicted HTH domain antitoxin